MNIKIISVGKLREKFFFDAAQEYLKRLTSYDSVFVTEIQAKSIKDDALIEKYKDEEAEKILTHIKENSFVITLEIEGKNLSSIDFAKKLKELKNLGLQEIIFIIGGANGLSTKISKLSNLKLSFSKMTFPHQLARIMLLEQLYRAERILANEPYHK